MIFLRWLRGTPPRVEVRCPDCGSNRPNYRMLEGTSHSWVNGKVVEEITGYTVACQACPCIYGISVQGTYKINPTSRPWGSVLLPQSPGAIEEPELQRPLAPLPKERPRV